MSPATGRVSAVRFPFPPLRGRGVRGEGIPAAINAGFTTRPTNCYWPRPGPCRPSTRRQHDPRAGTIAPIGLARLRLRRVEPACRSSRERVAGPSIRRRRIAAFLNVSTLTVRNRRLDRCEHFYHSRQWQIGNATADCAAAANQFIWSPRYIDAPFVATRILMARFRRPIACTTPLTRT